METFISKEQKFESIYNQKNRLYIDWDTHYICNLKCSYCYLQETLNTKTESNKTKQFLDILSKLKYSFTLGLLGGEPTIFKDYNFILEYFHNNIYPINNLSEIYISTNFTRNYNFYKNHKKYNNVHHWLSIHPEYYNNHNINILEKKIRIFIPNIDKQLIISPMLYDININKLFFKNLYDMFLRLKNDINTLEIIYSPQYINDGKQFKTHDLSPEFNQSIPEFILNNKKFTVNEIISKNINFFGSKCSPNYINVNALYNYTIPCLNIHGNIFNDILKILKFEPKSIICNFKTCNDFPKMLTSKGL